MIYKLDPTGNSPNNKVIDEIKVITPPGKVGDAHFIVPNYAPFFKEGFKVMLGTRELVEGIDFQFIFRHMTATTHFSREIFGGIMFFNPEFAGTVHLSYQTLGGDFQNNDPDAITAYTRAIGAVRWITFDQILGVPSSFPPSYHTHDIEKDLVGMGDVVDKLDDIAKALGTSSGNSDNEALGRHLNSDQAHSKSAVGLGNVMNYGVANLDDIRRGANDKYVTADTLKSFTSGLSKPATTESAVTKQQFDNLNASLTNLTTTKLDTSVFETTISQLRIDISRLPRGTVGGVTSDQVNELVEAKISPIVEKLTRTTDTATSANQEIINSVNGVGRLEISGRAEAFNTALTKQINETKKELETRLTAVEGNVTRGVQSVTDLQNKLPPEKKLWARVWFKSENHHANGDIDYYSTTEIINNLNKPTTIGGVAELLVSKTRRITQFGRDIVGSSTPSDGNQFLIRVPRTAKRIVPVLPTPTTLVNVRPAIQIDAIRSDGFLVSVYIDNRAEQQQIGAFDKTGLTMYVDVYVEQ